jgi:hypothetical protein
VSTGATALPPGRKGADAARRALVLTVPSTSVDSASLPRTSSRGNGLPQLFGRRSRRLQQAVTRADVSGMQQQMDFAALEHIKRQFYFQHFGVRAALMALAMERRTRFYKELVWYLAFVLLLLSVFWSHPVHYPFERNTVLADAIGGAESSHL